MVDRERHAVEQWFRRRGLPSVVRGRPTHVLVRSVPALAFLIMLGFVVDALALIDGASDEDFERLIQNDAYLLGYDALLIGWAVFPPVCAWLANRWLRRHTTGEPARAATVTAVVAIAFYALALPVLEKLIGTAGDIVPRIVVNVLLVLGALAVTVAGGGSVLAWAVRAAVRQLGTLGTMASRALPLLLLFTVFGFFTAELWQATAVLTRQQMWLVAGLFAAAALLFLGAMLSDEVRTLAGAALPAVDPGKLRGSPLESFLDEYVAAGPVRLRPVERVNMVLVLVLAEAFQAAVFGVVMFVFFVVFGVLAVHPEVMKAWSNQNPTVGNLFGVQVPVPNQLLHVSIFLAAFSALYFVASTVTDERYRRSFFEPLVDHLAVSLAARQVYLTRWP